MNNITKIYSLEENVEKTMVLMVTGVTDKGYSKKNEPYAAVELFDGEQKIPVHFFRESEETLAGKGVVKNAILKIALTLRGGYYNQSRWEINDDFNITENDFKKIAPIDIEQTFGWLIDKVKRVEKVGPYRSISSLTQEILETYQNEYKYSSAAVSMHHDYIGGLLYHSARMVSLAGNICDTFRSIDKELLVCAAALHDIGKIKCYYTDDIGNASITQDGRFFDHALTGIIMIRDIAQKNQYDPERIQMLLHCIAAHHGKAEWNAIATPAFKEAELLFLIDYMDSRVEMYDNAYKGQQPGTISEKRVYGLGNNTIYKPLSPAV